VPPFSSARLVCRLFAFCSWLSVALPAAEPDTGWSVNVWKTQDGLAGNNVTGLAEGTGGFMWIVAGNKIARFDGAQIEGFSPVGFTAEQAAQIRTVQRLRNGDLGFLTVDGMVGLAHDGKFMVIAAGLPPPARAESLAEDADGGLLIAFHTGAVCRLHDGVVSQLTESDGLPASHTLCVLATDENGNLWFAKAGAVGVFRAGRFETLLRLDEPNISLAAARHGGVWICSHLELIKYEPGGSMQKIGRVPVTNTQATPTVLLEDHTGAVWIGTSISGLFRYDHGEFENVPISHRQVVSLAEDHEGGLWVGTSGGGVNQVLRRAIRIEGEETGLPFRAVQAISEDPQGVLWAVAQDGTPVKRVAERWHNIFAPAENFEGEASDIAVDATGAVWIGTKNHRLYRWQGGRLESWGAAEGLLSRYIRTLIVSAAGDLWIGGGRPASLQRLRAGRLENFALPAQCDSIWAIAEGANGDIWAGGSGSGLLRVTSAGIVNDETHRAGSPSNLIRALHVTPDDTLWIGYAQGGVGRLKGDSFRRITINEGLTDDNLRMIISDGRGWLWFAAVTTLFKVREKELEAVATGSASRIQPVQYGADSGLHVVLGGTSRALLGHDGQLWLPFATSLAIIRPDRQILHTEPPPVLITRITVDDQVMASYGGSLPAPQGADITKVALKLEPAHRRVDFDFTALSLSAPMNVRFRYRLENFDDRWIEAGTRRSASYSRLQAGDYRFHVIASNGDGVWNDTGATIAFTVAPFPWATWWFRAALLLAFTGIVFGIARFIAGRRLQVKLRALEQQAVVERERSRIARDIHDDLGSRLTKITLLGGLGMRERQEPEMVGKRLTEISDTARQLIKSLDETVWAVNPRNDNLPQLVSYLGQFTAKFLGTAEIACDLDLPDDPPARAVSAEIRHSLFLIVKEALTNVVKHAHARAVRFIVTLDGDKLCVVIADNGLGGACTPDDPDADGLRNMRQRMRMLGGSFELESAPGAGTRLTLIMTLTG
jgi:signal transduction histidine kinase/ligand-binding sensor domain-containing protein